MKLSSLLTRDWNFIRYEIMVLWDCLFYLFIYFFFLMWRQLAKFLTYCMLLIHILYCFLFCFKVLPEKHSLKMIKNYSVQVNWFVFLVRMSFHCKQDTILFVFDLSTLLVNMSLKQFSHILHNNKQYVYDCHIVTK